MGYKYEIYTDGSCKKNGVKDAVGGWAFIIRRYDRNGEYIRVWFKSDWESNTTNNRMELTAILRALAWCEDIRNFYRCEDDSVYVYSDSAYIINCYTQGWYRKWEKNGWINSKKKPVENRDLWEDLIPWFKLKNYHFKKVKGHAGEELNELVDSMAQSAAANMSQSAVANMTRSISRTGEEEISWS